MSKRARSHSKIKGSPCERNSASHLAVEDANVVAQAGPPARYVTGRVDRNSDVGERRGVLRDGDWQDLRTTAIIISCQPTQAGVSPGETVGPEESLWLRNDGDAVSPEQRSCGWICRRLRAPSPRWSGALKGDSGIGVA